MRKFIFIAVFCLLSGIAARIISSQAPADASLLIESLAVSSVTDTGATVTWQTNKLANARVQFGPSPLYGKTLFDAGMLTDHRFDLTGLTQKTLYHYRVLSKDASGNWIVSSNLNFRTLAAPTPTPTPTPIPTPMPIPTPTPTPTPGGSEPAPPISFLNTTYTPPTGATINVAAGGDVQAAINQAQPGDVVVLQAGATFTGNFTLPNKSGSDWIIIRSSAADADLSLPGTRVTPGQSAFMPKLISPNSEPVIQTNAGAHHFRFVGVEFGVTAGTAIYNIIAFGGDQTSPADTPHDLIIDRCYIHGNPADNSRRGVMISSASTAIIDSYISDIHEIGADSQAICGWNGPGPFKIVNNYLEGAGENFMLGGAPPSLPNLIPSDVEFRLNHVYKPLSWKQGDPAYAGRPWTIKNLFELKNAQRVLVDQNVFENNWAESQNGFAILFTPRGEGVAPWATVADVTFTNNILRHSGSGFNIAGPDDTSPSQPSQRILIKNNLLDDIDGAKWGGADGRAIQAVGGPLNVTVDHNTIMQSGPLIMADGAPSLGFVFRNNIAPHRDYGVIGSGQCCGVTALNYYFPGAVFQRNVIVGVPQGINYPADNFMPASLSAVGFMDFINGDYRLTPTSPYKNAGADGKDIGYQW